MGLERMLSQFARGIASAFGLVATLNEILAAAIAEGINQGIQRLAPTIMKYVVIAAVLATGTLLLGYGIGRAADTFFATPGLGFAATGIIFILLAAIYLRMQSPRAQ